VQNIRGFLPNGMIVEAVGALATTLFLTVLRLDKSALGARMDMPQIRSVSLCPCFKNTGSSLARANGHQRLTHQRSCNALDEALVRHLNPVLAIRTISEDERPQKYLKERWAKARQKIKMAQ
jgi:hypothetical protein